MGSIFQFYVSRSAIAPFGLAFAVALCFVRASDASDHGGHGGHAGHGEAEAEGEIEIPEGVKSRGIELGEFRIHSHYPVEAQKSTVQFALYAAVATERYTEVKRVVDANEHKLRDQIIIATRMTPLAVFDEPGLENFRRRIFLRLRRAVPELGIDDVYVSAFNLTVKSL